MAQTMVACLRHEDRIHKINAFLDHVNVGDSVVCGSLEAYSCKLTGLDKQLSKSLDLEVQTDAPVAELATSPVGPLSEPSSRKTLVYLILTLNQCYPDYDFTQLRARHFRKEESASDVEGVVDSHLLSVSKVWEQNPRYGGSKFLDGLWSAIDEACALTDCDVYSYRTDRGDETPFEEQNSIWSFNYFFYNRKLKRIVHFTCRSLSTAAADDGEPQSTPEISLTTDVRSAEVADADSDSEIVGGMDDVS